MDVRPKIYLAGPYGFSELGEYGINYLIEKLENELDLINPFIQKENLLLGEKISDISRIIQESHEEMILADQIEELCELNHLIGLNNENEIRNCDGVIAVLDGPDVDSGTAAEIGFAYALGKPIWGYKGDFRVSRDNYGAKINLQVEYYIKSSGGCIFSSIREIKDNLEQIIRLCSFQ